jgi:hypothetical protein
MTPEVIAAIIGGIALLISSLIAAFATAKASRAEREASKATDRVTNAEKEIRELSATVLAIRLQISQNQNLQLQVVIAADTTAGTSKMARLNFSADMPGAALDAKPPEETRDGPAGEPTGQ